MNKNTENTIEKADVSTNEELSDIPQTKLPRMPYGTLNEKTLKRFLLQLAGFMCPAATDDLNEIHRLKLLHQRVRQTNQVLKCLTHHWIEDSVQMQRESSYYLAAYAPLSTKEKRRIIDSIAVRTRLMDTILANSTTIQHNTDYYTRLEHLTSHYIKGEPTE